MVCDSYDVSKSKVATMMAWLFNALQAENASVSLQLCYKQHKQVGDTVNASFIKLKSKSFRSSAIPATPPPNYSEPMDLRRLVIVCCVSKGGGEGDIIEHFSIELKE